MDLYWIDLETTGLDPHKDKVLEIYVARASLERPFDAKPFFHRVLHFDGPYHGLDPRVLEMHTRKGKTLLSLFEACAKSPIDHTLEWALSDLTNAMHASSGAPKAYEDVPVFAGASVHFDVNFLIAAGMHPGHFQHRFYDVSSIKLFCRSLGMPKLPKGEAHRAKEDVEEAIAHARACAEWLSVRPSKASAAVVKEARDLLSASGSVPAIVAQLDALAAILEMDAQ